MTDEPKKYPTYPKYSDNIRNLLKAPQPSRDQGQFESWLGSASPQELCDEAERLSQANGSRSEFGPILRRIMELVPDVYDPIRYKANLLSVQYVGTSSLSSVGYYEEALRGAEKIFGTKRDETLSTLDQLARSCSQHRQIAPGENAAKKLLARQEELFGTDSEKLIDTLLLLAHFVFLKYLKHHSKTIALWPEQEKLLRRALSIAEIHYPVDSGKTAEVLEQLAFGYHLEEIGEFEKAAQHYRRLLKIPTASRNDSFPCADFGKTLVKLGEKDELEELKRLFPNMRV